MLMENNRTEFKQDLNDKLEKEVLAFLNNREGGVLYIGVDDNGKGIGVSNLDDTQLKIADRIKNNILPSTLGLFDIVTESVDNVTVIKILISSGLEKPYYIKKNGMSPNGSLQEPELQLNKWPLQWLMTFIVKEYIQH